MRHRFLQIGKKKWINPHYITSITVEPQLRLLSKKPSTTEVHLNLLVPNGSFGGNALFMTGNTDSEKHIIEFESKREADNWVSENLLGRTGKS